MVRKSIYVFLIIVMLIILFVSSVIIINSIIKPDEVPDFFGWKPFIILSETMSPEINSGDVAVVKEIDVDNIKEHDIIAYRQKDVVTISRIMSIYRKNENVYITVKEDNLSNENKTDISFEQIEGIYIFKVNRLGNVAMFIQTPIGMVVILAIPLLILLIMQISSSVQNKKIEEENMKLKMKLEGTQNKEPINKH